MAVFACRVRTHRPAQVAAGNVDVFTMSLVKPWLLGFLWLLLLCRVRTRRPAQAVKNTGGERAPFPSGITEEGTAPPPLALHQVSDLGGGRIGKRRNSHVTWCLLSHGLGISSFQRPGVLCLVRVVLTAHPRSPIACGRQADILLWCHWLNPR